MTDEHISEASRGRASSLARWGAPLAVGLMAACFVFALLFYDTVLSRKEQERADALRSLAVVRASLDHTWDRTAVWAEQLSRQLTGVQKSRLSAVLGQCAALWPEAGISLYDRNGDLISLPATSDAPGLAGVPSDDSVRRLVAEALEGKIGRDITLARGFLSLSAAAPVHGAEVRVLALTVPLDVFLLQAVKTQAGAEVAVLSFGEGKTLAESGISSAASTFTQSTTRAARVWSELAGSLVAAKVGTEEALPVAGEGISAGVAPLLGADGIARGLLVSAPMEAPAAGSQMWRFGAALLAGVAGALLTAFFQRRRARYLAQDVAEAITAIAEEQPVALKNTLPEPLQEALDKMGETLQQYRNRARDAERQKQQATGWRRRREDDPATLTRAEDDYLRLFANVPVGVFQAHENGRFIRVNEAFSMLLGYDSPGQLLAESASFSELFLYGGEFLNPLNALLGHGTDRQLISLRRRDGRVRHFALIVWTLTTAKGDQAGIVEGFLIDRELDEQKTRAERERDYAKRERASLALLLAATCRQTQSFLEPSHRVRAVLERQEDAAPPLGACEGSGEDAEDLLEGVRERRKSVLAVRLVLNDIYQIAMTELDSAPPVVVPIDFGRFLQRTCRRSLPSLQSRGVSLRCDVTEELLRRLSGSVALLRHALQRGLQAIVAPVHGGWAVIGVRRDPNAPKSPGVSRVLFSIAWSPLSPDMGSSLAKFEHGLRQAKEQDVHIFNEIVEPDSQAPDTVLDSGGLEIADEQEVIRYLVKKMHGDLLDCVFTNDARSIQFVVPLMHMAESLSSLEESAHEAVLEHPDESPLAQPSDSAVTFSDAGMAGLADGEEASSLELLVMDQIGAQDDYAHEGFDDDYVEGLDILLVEDALNSRLLFSLFLRETSHRITEAHDGQEGVEAFQRGHYDVVFMDMEMPLMDGYQATRIIRALEADKNLSPTPIVAMTAYALPEFQRQCMLAGCTDFLSKPFSKHSLLSMLDALMQMKEDRQGLTAHE